MTAEISVLIITAFSVGFIHTILGPDHYLPFVAMARSNKWPVRKTLLITSLCGVGHILGSVVIGVCGILLGTLVFQIESIEAFRGDVAAWLLIGFGLAYLTWGIVTVIRDIPHTHLHSHADGTVHSHLHQHDVEHRHLHVGEAQDSETAALPKPSNSITPWLLFLIFAFGPCEVLIPLLMYPAAEANTLAIAGVVLAFSVATVSTMVVSVMAICFGLNMVATSVAKAPNLHRYSHALAGLAVLACGVLVKFGL